MCTVIVCAESFTSYEHCIGKKRPMAGDLSCSRIDTPDFSISAQILLAPKFEDRNHRRLGLAFTTLSMHGHPANVSESTMARSAMGALQGPRRRTRCVDGRGVGAERAGTRATIAGRPQGRERDRAI